MKDESSSRSRLRLAYCALAVLSYSLMFQGTRGLWEPDEGRYTNIAYQMLKSGNYLVPALNDELHHLAKPPLTYWVIAAGIELGGSNEWGARVPYALAFSTTIFLIYAIALHTNPRRPWFPPLIYATSLFSFAAGNLITTDMLLTCWETLAVLGFVQWYQHTRDAYSRHGLLLMWSGFALAFLTKGPPGLLPMAAIMLFTWETRGWRSILGLLTLDGLLVFCIVGLGWYLYIIVTLPGALDYFVRKEVVERVASSAFKRNAEWYGALVVYLPILLVGALPWNFAFLRAAKSLPATLFSRGWWRNRADSDPWVVFLALWILLPLAVFVVSRSRLPLYILPLFVPLALASGRLLADVRFSRVGKNAVTAWAAALLFLKWSAAHYSYPEDSRVLARDISAALPTPPGEVLFVDLSPYWGLHLYLDCEVERVASEPSMATEPGTQSLAFELAQNEPNLLFIVAKEATVDVESKLVAHGRKPRVVGGTSRYAFIAVDNDT